MRVLCGVDPGRSGAVGFLRGAEAWGELLDTTDGSALADLILSAGPSVVAVEVPAGRPPQHGGWRSIAQQWRAIGVVEGVVLARGIPLVRVSPVQWQAEAFRGSKKPKDYAGRKSLSLRRARERFPGARLDRVKDGALADALWIALTAEGGAA